MLKGLLGSYNRLKIRDKLILYFVSLVSVSMTTIFVITYVRLADIINTKISNYSSVILREVCNDIDEMLEGTMELKYYVLPNDGLQEILSAGSLNSDQPSVDSNVMQNYMMNLINAKDYLTSVTFFGKSGYKYFYSKVPADTASALNDIIKGGLFDELRRQNGKMVWYGLDKDKNSYVIAMQILSRTKLEDVGIMVINLDMNMIAKIYEKSKTDVNGRFYVVDKNGEIIFHSDKTLIGSKIDPRLASSIHTSKGNLLTRKEAGVSSMIIHYPSSKVGWEYIYSVPESEMMDEMVKSRTYLILIFAGSVILAVLFSIKISFGLTKPIKQLMEHMKKAEKGDLDVRVQLKTQDEIGQLGGKFNKMIGNIQNLINSVYKEGLMRKDAEFKALQAQINPHFLYNTLDSINALAELKGVEEISKITVAFSKLLRAAMSKDESIITLKGELEYINNYMTIIKIRHNERIKFHLDIQEETLGCKLPRLLVQPLVENSVVHSFNGKDGDCVITVKSWLEDKDFMVQVEDNGMGMDDPEGQIHHQPQSGLGLSSVIKRMELLYGNKQSIAILSKKNFGTRITLKLPKQFHVEKEDEN